MTPPLYRHIFEVQKMDKDAKIYVAGHRGLVGSAILRRLKIDGYSNIVTRTHNELDLCIQADVSSFFASEKPEYVFLAAAKVGGIGANRKNPYNFLYDNIMIQNNIINESVKQGVRKIIFLGSSCIYPKDCLQPMREESLLTGELEPTNEGYALAKIIGLRSLQYLHAEKNIDSLLLMPCNLYGINDDFSAENSHVMAALVKKFVDATISGQEEVICWGTGSARREFLNVDDMVDAIFLLLSNNPYGTQIINIGSGSDVTIKELAEIVAKLTGYTGRITWDRTKPDGMIRKCMDVTKIKKLGFLPQIDLNTGIKIMIDIYKKRVATD